MPKIEVSYKDLCKLIGKKISMKVLKEEAILFAKGEIEEVIGDILKIDIKDTNRPDLWSTEGIAREIKSRYFLNPPKYKTTESNIVVNVNKKVKYVRPYTVCAVIRDINITDDVLSQMIQLQEKVSITFGRGRKEVAIGIYDLDKIKSPIRYTTVKPEEIKFIPLDFQEEMTPKDIINKHPKGKEFGHLLKGKNEYPVFLDSQGNVLSLPPIINSEYTGKVTKETKNIFIECSGFDFKFLYPALNVLVCALIDRGGHVQKVKIVYPETTIKTPDLTLKKIDVDPHYINTISGLDLTNNEILILLKKSGYIPKQKNGKFEVFYPPYRQDIMHPRDVVEDVIISYGYNRIEPLLPKIPTIGKADKFQIFSNDLSEIMIGLGFQEILSYILTNKDNIFRKMRLKEMKVVEIKNPISTNWCIFRTWLTPSLMEFLSKNKHVEYPQKIFEIGDCVIPDKKAETRTRDIKKIAVAISDNEIGYENISSILDAFLTTLGINYEMKAKTYPWLIDGRSAAILMGRKDVGFIGEIHPKVLLNWNLEMPTVVFEIDIEAIKKI